MEQAESVAPLDRFFRWLITKIVRAEEDVQHGMHDAVFDEASLLHTTGKQRDPADFWTDSDGLLHYKGTV